MSRPSRANALAAHVTAQQGCVSAKELASIFGYKSLSVARTQGLIAEVLPRVYAPSARHTELDTRLSALALWLPASCVVSGLAALWLLGLTEDAPRTLTVIAPRELHMNAPTWLRIRRTGLVKTREVRAGVMCAARERAVIDAWAEANPALRESIVLEALRRSNMKGATVLRALDQIPRVHGRRALVNVLREASDGIQSYLESRAKRTVLNTADFRGLERQVVFFAMGQRYVVDTYHRASNTVIEFDGAKVHGSFAAKKRDNARDAALATLAVLTVRIGFDDVMKRPEWCRDVIRRTIAARLR